MDKMNIIVDGVNTTITIITIFIILLIYCKKKKKRRKIKKIVDKLLFVFVCVTDDLLSLNRPVTA